MKRWAAKIKIDPSVGVWIVVALCLALGVITADDKSAAPRAHPPMHLVTITIDQITVTVPVFGTNVDFKVQ